MKQVTRAWTGGDWLDTNTPLNTAINRVIHKTDQKLVNFIDYLNKTKILKKESFYWKESKPFYENIFISYF